MAKALKVSVLAITDGDTLNVASNGAQLTVRIACIDAPELAQEPLGAIARDALTGLVPVGSKLSLRSKGLDAYGRTVAELFDRRRRNIGATLVRNGHAFVDERYAGDCDQDQLTRFQDEARSQSRGVWNATDLLKPWDYRNPAPSPSTAPDPEPGAIPAFTGSRLITCTQISSKEEAASWLAAGHSYLDADRDGCACESQFPC